MACPLNVLLKFNIKGNNCLSNKDYQVYAVSAQVKWTKCCPGLKMASMGNKKEKTFSSPIMSNGGGGKCQCR